MTWWRVDLGEAAAQAAYQAVINRQMSLGQVTCNFERRVAELLQVPYVVATSSGTAALTLALLEAGVGPGDEVVVPNRTWIATAHAPLLLGARTVLVDVESNRPLMDPEAFDKAITPHTKAVIPVHLNGRVADISRIQAIADRYGVHVIEDAAQAFYVRTSDGFLGTLSRAGCFSLSIGKAITCGQGGFVVTHDAEIAKRLSLARTHGTANIHTSKWEMVGGNFRMWDLPAAIALTQLDMLEQRIRGVLDVYRRYELGLRNQKAVTLLPVDVASGEIPLYAEVFCPKREHLISWLDHRGIQARPMHSDLNEAPQFGCNTGKYPNSLRYGKECLVLPCGPDRESSEVDAVIELINMYSAQFFN